MTQLSPRIALFDMDQTLFDFEGQMRKDLLKLWSPSEQNPLTIGNLWEAEKANPWLRARMSLIKRQPGWWKNLPILKLGWKIFCDCRAMGFQNEILTKGPNRNPRAWAEKYECLKKHEAFAKCPIYMVDSDSEMTVAKGRVYGRVLVDDFPEYVEAWLEHRPRGLVIMPATPSNKDYHHPCVIRYDGTNGNEVHNALQAAFHRDDGQHWKDWKNPWGCLPADQKIDGMPDFLPMTGEIDCDCFDEIIGAPINDCP